jgi:hypothetical protein
MAVAWGSNSAGGRSRAGRQNPSGCDRADTAGQYPKPARKVVGRKKATRKKPVVAKRKPEGWRGRVKPTGKVIEPTETATP